MFRSVLAPRRAARSPEAARLGGDVGQIPTPEESARSILAVFKASRASANEVLMLGAVDRKFLSQRDPRTVDFTSGLRHAVDMGWVELTGQGRQLRLTQTGFDAMLGQGAANRAAMRR